MADDVHPDKEAEASHQKWQQSILQYTEGKI